MTDVNDNAPLFNRRSFKTSRPVVENAPVGTTVLRVIARDLDSGDNGRITYKYGSNIPKDLPFSLNPDTGEIKVSRSLDYEKKQRYKFYVRSYDHGVPPKSDQASVTIEIDNINDNPPTFVNSSYKINLSEDTRKGVMFITVSATDPDQLSNTDFEYSIAEGDSNRCFHIDTFSGGVSLLGCNLDYKKQATYKLKLKVVDVSGKAGYSYLNINVFDANNNAPRYAIFYLFIK